MKKYAALIVWILISCSTFSQVINPQIIEIKSDTHFCFSIDQSRIIAKELIKSQYADSLEIQLDKTISLYQYQQQELDSIIGVQQLRIQNTDTIVSNQQEQIMLLEAALEQKNKTIKKNKFQKIALSIVSTLTTIASFIALAN